jgi:hypothetical protein
MRPITTSILALSLALLGCGGSQPEPAQPAPVAAEPDPCGPGDDVEQGAKTAGASAELGGRTAVEGVKTAGKTVGGFVEGGSDEAKEKWNEGKEDTRETARSGAKKVQTASTTRPCTPGAPKK